MRGHVERFVEVRETFPDGDETRQSIREVTAFPFSRGESFVFGEEVGGHEREPSRAFSPFVSFRDVSTRFSERVRVQRPRGVRQGFVFRDVGPSFDGEEEAVQVGGRRATQALDRGVSLSRKVKMSSSQTLQVDGEALARLGDFSPHSEVTESGSRLNDGDVNGGWKSAAEEQIHPDVGASRVRATQGGAHEVRRIIKFFRQLSHDDALEVVEDVPGDGALLEKVLDSVVRLEFRPRDVRRFVRSSLFFDGGVKHVFETGASDGEGFWAGDQG